MKKIILLSLIFLLLLSFASAQGAQQFCIGDTPCINLINSEFQKFLQSAKEGEQFEIILVTSPTCPHCLNLKEHLNALIAQYPEKIKLTDWTYSEHLTEIQEIQEQFNVPFESRGSVPQAFLKGKENNGGTITEVNAWQLMLLAAVDAINPCELAVLVILMTAILARFPDKKRKALEAGLAFSLAILIMYFVFGLLLILGYGFITGTGLFNPIIFFKILGAIAIILGLLNIKDAIWYGGGGFIMEVPQKWRPRMKGIISGTTSTKGAFIVGLIVSFFLTPCTMGPYLVAGGLLSQIALITALPLLLLYLAIFISPMIAITLIVFSGFKAVEDIGGWRETNIKKLHWIAGIILVGLGIALVLGLI